jgi:hypothetical protein
VLALLIAHKQTNIAHPHKQHKKIHPQPQQEPNKFIKATQTKNKKSPLEISPCRKPTTNKEEKTESQSIDILGWLSVYRNINQTHKKSLVKLN